ncbi:uncharacterized protein LOC122861184 [Aphidius gifuensis]|uniref:uncharacterized protein LOC122861184 n=1 Tax=Aphidius gifuensis TaxID=684658 RepID=UPI001CDCB614|nr:uncharacterized protein LOC122861184 [Aphidius gifuensis]
MIVKLLKRLILILMILQKTFSLQECVNNTKNLRLKRDNTEGKRYLVFPQGSNVQLIYCMTIGTYAKPQGVFTMGITAGLAWELPHHKTVPYRKPAEVYHRRSRRELYKKIELMFNTRGKDGKACVLKALCQAGKRKSSEVGNAIFMKEILHSLFTLPNGSYHIDPKTEYEYAHESTEDCLQITVC